MFEHRSHKILPFSHFLKRLSSFAFFTFLLIGFSVGIGVLGYKNIAGLSWIDSFHMSCLILTGVGPVAEMKTNAAKLFSSFYALYSGVAFLTIAAVFFTPIIHRFLHVFHVKNDED